MPWVTISGGGYCTEEELACLPQLLVAMLGNHVCVDAKLSPFLSVCTCAPWGRGSNPTVVCSFPVPLFLSVPLLWTRRNSSCDFLLYLLALPLLLKGAVRTEKLCWKYLGKTKEVHFLWNQHKGLWEKKKTPYTSSES